MKEHVFTSESVTEGHPDKMCDQISDAVLDCILAQDPTARVACETATTTGMVLVMGEDVYKRQAVCCVSWKTSRGIGRRRAAVPDSWGRCRSLVCRS